MKKLFIVLPFVFLLCFAFSCQQQGEEAAEEPVVDVEADVAAIKASVDEYDAAYNAGDIERIIAIYADNAVQIPPNEPAIIGKEAIQDDFQEEFDQSTLEMKDVVVDVHVSGDLGFSRGTWTSIQTPKAGGESRKFSGNWVFIHLRQPDGSWKVICETWSEDSLIYPPQEKE